MRLLTYLELCRCTEPELLGPVLPRCLRNPGCRPVPLGTSTPC